MQVIEKRDFNSWKSLKNNMGVIIRASFVSILAVCVWLSIQHFGLSLDKKYADFMTQGPITFIAVFHALLASLILNEVNKQYMEKSSDEATTKIHPPTPDVIKQLIGIFSIFMVGLACWLEYSEFWLGFVCVFSYTFVLSAYWVVLSDMEELLAKTE